tara:strand:+ start:150 stop:311 length:162 start_codon:yes stop_codon:yes gene_type:complete
LNTLLLQVAEALVLPIQEQLPQVAVAGLVGTVPPLWGNIQAVAQLQKLFLMCQ